MWKHGLSTLVLVLVGMLPVAGPGNISQDPSGKQAPEVRLDEMEMRPETVIPEHKANQTADTVDWSVSQLNAEKAWENGWTGKGVTFAVLDTGIDPDHRDVSPNLIEAKDFTGSRTGSSDIVGHGTHCWGSIAAAGNGWGMKGVAFEARGYAVKVLGDNGSGSVDRIAAGLRWAVEKRVRVISLSLGGPGTDSFIPDALKEAEEAGVIVIAANGNDNGGPVSYPAAYPTPVAISAVDRNKLLAGFSNVGRKTEACGPGVGVRSTYPGNRFADMSGTSMATPNVAGVAVLWSQWADANKVPDKERPARFRKFLETGCVDLGAPGRDSNYGWGLPDLSKLGKAEPKPPAPPAPGAVEFDESDLNEKGLKKLRDAKIDGFLLRIGKGAKAEPPSAPKITTAEILDKVKAGEDVVIAVGVKLDLEKWPKGYELSETPEEVGLDPGVYRCFGVTKIGVEPLK